MSLLSYFRSIFVVEPATRPVPRYDFATGEGVGDYDVLALSTAYACVRLLAGNIGGLPIEVLQPVGADGIEAQARDHPLWRLLHDSPNSEQTAFDFFEDAGASLELKGNAVARKEFTGSRVSSLEPMLWDETQPYRTSNGAVRYRWKGQDLSSDEVLHLRGFGGDALGALSTIAVAGATFGLAKALNRAAGSTFRNGIRTQTALSPDRDLTPEQMEAARSMIEERYAGAINSGRPLLLNNGLKVQQLSINPEDAQLLESRAFSVEEICRLFQVPPFMVGHSEKSTSWGTGLEQQTLGFLTYTLRPRLKRIEQALEKQLLTAQDRGKGVSIKFNVDALLRSDSAARAAYFQAALGDTQKPGWMLRSEVRKLENLPPIPGFEKPIQLFQQAPKPPAAD